MTSSLVGSEMCIRDSVFASHVGLWSRVSRLRLGTAYGEEGQEYGGHAAVSYTHLTLPTICSV
eukprot:12876501-Prorocentrum_lima.AAC.1